MRSRLVFADSIVLPLASRTVVRFPVVFAEPIVRPELSRSIVRLPDCVAEPCVRPDASRKVLTVLANMFLCSVTLYHEDFGHLRQGLYS
jgi:hypothetical protein